MLVGFTSYWSVFDAQALKEKDANKRPLLEQQQIRRGRILAADGTVIARSVAEGPRRRPPLRQALPGRARSTGTRSATASSQQGDTEFEQFHNDELIGEESEFSSILDELRGETQEGNDIVTNLDPEAQRVALTGSRRRVRRGRRDRARAPGGSRCSPRTRRTTRTWSPNTSTS